MRKLSFLLLAALLSTGVQAKKKPHPHTPTAAISANPSTIEQGHSSTLSWTTTNSSTISIDQGIGNVSASGSRSVSPASSTTYTLTAQGMGGGSTASATARITVMPPVPAPMSNLPTLPQLFVDTTYTPPAGNTIAVGPGGDFQSALNAAVAGDVITLNAGSTYTGNFVLPSKIGSSYIHIRSSAALTVESSRVTTAQAAAFPKIVTPNVGGAIQAAAASSYYRFINCEIKSSATPVNGFLVGLGSGEETNPADFPHHIIFDRCYIHGDATNGGRRGIMLSGNYQAVIDSYVSDWKEVGNDTQAIAAWTGFGPYKIQNNYLEGAGENILIGGAGTGGIVLSPSDIEIRGNYFFKPLSWKVGDPSYAGTHWSVKNLLELKNAKRVLIENNTFENNWADSQAGWGILFTVRNQTGSTPWATIEDVTYRWNVLKNSAGGVDILGNDDEFPSQPVARILIENNLHQDITDSLLGHFLILRGVIDLQINHNTCIGSGSIIIAAGGNPNTRFIFNNNIALHNDYGIVGDGQAPGNATLATYFPGADIRRNIIVMNTGDYSAQYPADNFYPLNVATVDFVNYAGKDYRLKATSPYYNQGTDGTSPGVQTQPIQASGREPASDRKTAAVRTKSANRNPRS
jgi:hypothetical protein